MLCILFTLFCLCVCVCVFIRIHIERQQSQSINISKQAVVNFLKLTKWCVCVFGCVCMCERENVCVCVCVCSCGVFTNSCGDFQIGFNIKVVCSMLSVYHDCYSSVCVFCWFDCVTGVHGDFRMIFSQR